MPISLVFLMTWMQRRDPVAWTYWSLHFMIGRGTTFANCFGVIKVVLRRSLHRPRRCELWLSDKVVYWRDARSRAGSLRLRREQCLVVRFHRPVAFADGLLQGLNIRDLNMAPRIFYHSGLLKRA